MLDDDTARDLALFAGLEWPEDDRTLLAPLIDATLLWVDEVELDQIAAPIVEALWADDLGGDIGRALDDYEERHGEVAGARADLAMGAAMSRLAIAYAKQGAVELGQAPFVRGRCMCCMEDGLGSAPVDAHERIAVEAAAAFVCHTDPDVAAADPTDAERLRVRRRLADVAALAERSLPRLAGEFQRFANQRLPAPDDDELWRAVQAELYGDFTLPNE